MTVQPPMPPADPISPNDEVHKVLTKDMQKFMDGSVHNITAWCGKVLVPRFDDEEGSARAMCEICFPLYTQAH